MGISRPRVWLASIDAETLDEWFAFYQLEPWDKPTQEAAPHLSQPPASRETRWITADLAERQLRAACGL